MKEEPAEQDIPRSARSSQKSSLGDTLRGGSLLETETLQSLEEEFKIKELKRKIAKIDEKLFKHKIIIAISAVGSFLLVTSLFYLHLFKTSDTFDYNLSAALSLVAGFFAAFLIMAISGIIKEFSIKSGLIEVSSKLEQKIENVQTNVEISKKEVEEKISTLNQNITNAIQSINNNIAANWNKNQQSVESKTGDITINNITEKEEKEKTEERTAKIIQGYIEGEGVNRSTAQLNNFNLEERTEERTIKIQEGFKKGIEQLKGLEERNTEDILETEPIERVARQQALEAE